LEATEQNEFPQIIQYGRGDGNSNFTGETLSETTAGKCSSLLTAESRNANTMHSLHDGMSGALNLSSHTHHMNIKRTISDKYQLIDILNTMQNYEIHKKKANQRNSHILVLTIQTGQVNAIWGSRWYL
jgi:hypothetical protein